VAFKIQILIPRVIASRDSEM